MQKTSYTKTSYKDALQKKAVRDFLFSHFQFNKIVGLPGPDIQHYISWCKSKGYTEIEAWEYEPLVALMQLGEIPTDSISYNMGDIINAEIKDDVVYDLDYCRTIKYMGDHLKKFRKNFVMTFSRRLKGFCPEMLFKMLDEQIISSKDYNSPINYTKYKTDKGEYLYAPYWDTSAMFSIAKIK